MVARFGGFLRAGTPAAKPDKEVFQRVKNWTRTALGLAAEASVAVNEIVCPDPSCPGIETVMVVMEPGKKTRAYKIAKAIDAVTEQDIRDALV